MRMALQGGIIIAMTFPLQGLPSAIEDRASAWAALRLCQRARPVHPNHGKAVTGVEFESAEWLVDVAPWDSGEADLSTVRLIDDRVASTAGAWTEAATGHRLGRMATARSRATSAVGATAVQISRIRHH
ncbi:hypothetical protein AB0F81_15625 [Actinoplanes sp. NPDC024001]|uniref:hypothetical protein n=1 Tax=Actinoplanes sp. NPDC024001 TaxID=3154598 RepID=UPI0033E69EB2